MELFLLNLLNISQLSYTSLFSSFVSVAAFCNVLFLKLGVFWVAVLVFFGFALCIGCLTNLEREWPLCSEKKS